MEIGKHLVLIGIFVVVLGLVFIAIGKLTGGKGLPGDIYYHGDRVAIYIPIVTMITISLLLTLILNLFFTLRR